MDELKKKVSDLEISEEHKKALTLLYTPKSIAELAAAMNRSYQWALNYILIWKAKGWIRQVSRINKEKKWMLNKAKLEV